MYEYLQICVLLSCAFAATLSLLKTAPARLKLGLTILAMGIWLVPWSVLDVELPHSVAEPFQAIRVQLHQPAAAIAAKSAEQQNTITSNPLESPETIANHGLQSVAQAVSALLPAEQTLLTAFCFLSGVGALLWLNSLFGFFRARRVWVKHAVDANHLKDAFQIIPRRANVLYSRCPGPGMTSGLFKPTIWIRPDIKDPELLTTLITHESVHVIHHDYFWCWTIGLLEKLFWWNPFVRLFANKATAYIELSCDEHAAKIIPKDSYRLALIKILCQEQTKMASAMTLGIGNGLSLDFLRTKELTTTKVLKSNHVSLVAAALMTASMLALLLAHDSRYADVFTDSHSNYHQLKALSYIKGDTMYRDTSPLHSFNEAVIRGDHQYTAEHVDNLITLTSQASIDQKILGFRILAVYFDRLQDHEYLLQLGDRFFDPKIRKNNKHINRIYVIAYIKLGQHDLAMDLLEDTAYMGLVNLMLQAQTLHLKQDYERSNQTIEKILTYRHRSIFPTIKTYAYRLYGKNLTLLGKVDEVKEVSQQLGVQAPDDFLDVRADNQRVPYIYSLNNFVEGVRIDGFDQEQFPLATSNIGSVSYATQKALSHALAASAETTGTKSAIQIINTALAETPMSDKQTRTILLEHLLLLYVRQENIVKAKQISAQLLALDHASNAMKARALWILSGRTNKEHSINQAYFEAYVDLYEGASSIALDHEIIKRYPFFDSLPRASEALQKVSSFYAQHNKVPDIKVLNKMIYLYEQQGDNDKAMQYRLDYQRAYPHALNYIFE